MSRAESEAVCSPSWGSLRLWEKKGASSSGCLPRDPSVCRQGLPQGLQGLGGPQATPGGGCEQVQLDTLHISHHHTLDGLHGVRGLGLVVVTAQSPNVSAGARCGELEASPE